jgi:hypothetical protein
MTATGVPGEQVAGLLAGLSRARRRLSRLVTEEPAPMGSSGVSALAEIVRHGPLRLGDLAAVPALHRLLDEVN